MRITHMGDLNDDDLFTVLRYFTFSHSRAVCFGFFSSSFFYILKYQTPIRKYEWINECMRLLCLILSLIRDVRWTLDLNRSQLTTLYRLYLIVDWFEPFYYSTESNSIGKWNGINDPDFFFFQMLGQSSIWMTVDYWLFNTKYVICVLFETEFIDCIVIDLYLFLAYKSLVVEHKWCAREKCIENVCECDGFSISIAQRKAIIRRTDDLSEHKWREWWTENINTKYEIIS